MSSSSMPSCWASPDVLSSALRRRLFFDANRHRELLRCFSIIAVCQRHRAEPVPGEIDLVLSNDANARKILLLEEAGGTLAHQEHARQWPYPEEVAPVPG